MPAQRLQRGAPFFGIVFCLSWSYVAGSPLAGPVSQATDAARDAPIAEVRNGLGKYTSNSEAAFPIAAHLLSARV
jgi:hypothetical protein